MQRQLIALLGSAASVTVVTLLVWALEPIAPTLSLGVLYTLAVLATAVAFGLAYAFVTALASMVAFNFLFLPPVHTLTLADARNWTALAVYLATAIVSSQLAASTRRRAADAEQREREAILLADAAAAVLQEQSLAEIRRQGEEILAGRDERARARFAAAVDALLALADERREAEAVRRSDAIKTVVLHTVSHDFRTPIATIQAAVGGLQDTQLALSASDRADLLETIGIEVTRLSRLVENVLDLSRLQTGAAAPHPALWDVDDLLAQAGAEVSTPARLRVAVPDGLAPVRVDAVQLQRVLVNLIKNALKFSTGPVEAQATEQGAEIVVEILDRGPGIDDAPSSHAGLGLGLAIAHGFAEANDANLELGPREGGGTIARLTVAAEPMPAGLLT